MPEPKYQAVRPYIAPRLIIRLRIFSIVFLVMLGIVGSEVFGNTIRISLALVGMLMGIVLGVIVSRMYRLSWDEQTVQVVARIDWIGAIILVVYILFALGRNWLFGHWIQATTLAAFGLSISAGTMLGRVVGTMHGIRRMVQALLAFTPRDVLDT